jgi:exonuclease III
VRIVSWNVNQQGRDTWAFLVGTLDPDIALVQEAILPTDLPDQYQVRWTPAWPDGRWGSAVLSRFRNLEPDWEDWRRGAVLMAHCSIPSLGPVSIASVHARVNPLTHRVIPDLRETFDHLRRRLGDRFILGGDLNTAREAARRWPRNGHLEFWRDVETWGLRDCHYLLNGVERQSFWRGVLRNRPPTMDGLQDDHVFVDAETIKAVTQCFVLDTPEVRRLSDHGPVVVELTLPSDSRQSLGHREGGR